MDLSALKTYLQTNYATQLAAGDDGAIWGLMQSSGGTKVGSIAKGDFVVWAASTGVRATIEDLCNSTGNPLRPSALALRDFFMGSAPSFAADSSANSGLISAWVTAGAITQAQANSLMSLAQQPITVAERDGFAGITITDIANARTLI